MQDSDFVRYITQMEEEYFEDKMVPLPIKS